MEDTMGVISGLRYDFQETVDLVDYIMVIQDQ